MPKPLDTRSSAVSARAGPIMVAAAATAAQAQVTVLRANVMLPSCRRRRGRETQPVGRKAIDTEMSKAPARTPRAVQPEGHDAQAKNAAENVFGDKPVPFWCRRAA